jgi:hypothetical protein
MSDFYETTDGYSIIAVRINDDGAELYTEDGRFINIDPSNAVKEI